MAAAAEQKRELAELYTKSYENSERERDSTTMAAAWLTSAKCSLKF